MTVVKKLKKEAIALGICDWGKESWDKKNLVPLYITAITWCMEREYPALNLMKKFDSELVANGVYNNKKERLLGTKDTFVFNSSDIELILPDYAVCRVYLGRGSKLHAVLGNKSILYVDNYGCDITVDNPYNATFKVWDLGLKTNSART